MARIQSLWLVVMAVAVLANPLDASHRHVDGCARVRCRAGTTCKVVDGKPACVPIGGRPCGPAVCARGLQCCNPSCGICTKPGQSCTMQACGPVCGPKQCAYGEECCNASCGICTKPGQVCTMQACGPVCGPKQCAYGEECCNESCGYCTKPGEGCTKELCLPR